MHATLRGVACHPDYVPSWTQSFFNEATVRQLIPADLWPNDLARWPARDKDPFVPTAWPNWTFFDQDLPEMERRLNLAVRQGRPGGRYILMDAGGIPDSLSRAKFDTYRLMSRRVRGQIQCPF